MARFPRTGRPAARPSIRAILRATPPSQLIVDAVGLLCLFGALAIALRCAALLEAAL